jgi:hypothetical protein
LGSRVGRGVACGSSCGCGDHNRGGRVHSRVHGGHLSMLVF